MMQSACLLALLFSTTVLGLIQPQHKTNFRRTPYISLHGSSAYENEVEYENHLIPQSLRSNIYDGNVKGAVQLLKCLSLATLTAASANAAEGKLEFQPALQGLDYGKPRTYYPDFTQAENGLQYKVVKAGDGAVPKAGDKVSIDWEGYTIGYYGRPFQTRNKVKGGAFDSTQTDYFRFVVGDGTAIAALDKGIQYMKEGGITQIVVPAELGYPIGDPDHNIVGPKPGSFSGQRALNFVLDNKNLIDKTLLINVKLVKVEQGYADRKAGRV